MSRRAAIVLAILVALVLAGDRRAFRFHVVLAWIWWDYFEHGDFDGGCKAASGPSRGKTRGCLRHPEPG
jgi:hypothetical protein